MRAEEEAAGEVEHKAFQAELLELRRQLIDLKFELAWRRVQSVKALHPPRDQLAADPSIHHSNSQPRIPKGNPGGGQWTDGTGMTENALCIDGRLHKISEDLTWDYDLSDFSRPWRIRAPQTQRVDLEFVPRIEHAQHINLWLLKTDLHWALGHFRGTIVADSGERLAIDHLLGWAEDHRARW